MWYTKFAPLPPKTQAMTDDNVGLDFNKTDDNIIRFMFDQAKCNSVALHDLAKKTFIQENKKRGIICVNCESGDTSVLTKKPTYGYLTRDNIVDSDWIEVLSNVDSHDPVKAFVFAVLIRMNNGKRHCRYATIKRDAQDKIENKPSDMPTNIELVDMNNATITVKCMKCGKVDIKMDVCARCKDVHYCGKECQKRDWKIHKQYCVEHQ